MSMEDRVSYAKEFLGIEILPNAMKREDIQITSGLSGLQSGTVDHKCGACGREASLVVVAQHAKLKIRWLACPSCKHGSVLTGGKIYPRSIFGEDVKGLPETIKSAYLEARKSVSVECYTACEIVCRKILMNVAVDKGAPEGKTFAEYIDYMVGAGYITVTMKPWVDKIKENGNNAAHEIRSPNPNRTKSTLKFTMFLLKNMYETEYDLQEISNSDDTAKTKQQRTVHTRLRS